MILCDFSVIMFFGRSAQSSRKASRGSANQNVTGIPRAAGAGAGGGTSASASSCAGVSGGHSTGASSPLASSAAAEAAAKAAAEGLSPEELAALEAKAAEERADCTEMLAGMPMTLEVMSDGEGRVHLNVLQLGMKGPMAQRPYQAIRKFSHREASCDKAVDA